MVAGARAAPSAGTGDRTQEDICMTALGPARTIPDHRAKARASRPGILLDRDGTLIVDHGYVGSIDRVDFIDGAAAAIALFNRAASRS